MFSTNYFTTLGKIFRKYKVRVNRIMLIRQLIESLGFDETEKALYYGSLNVLDEDGLDAFYERLTEIMGKYENTQIVRDAEKRKSDTLIASAQEASEREKAPELNILFDNI